MPRLSKTNKTRWSPIRNAPKAKVPEEGREPTPFVGFY